MPMSDVPNLISKKWLLNHFNLVTPGGYSAPGVLYRYVLTQEIIQALNLTMEVVRCKSFKRFNAVQSQRLRILLNLDGNNTPAPAPLPSGGTASPSTYRPLELPFTSPADTPA